VQASGCYGGINRVTTGLINFVAGCLVWTNLTTSSQGCCGCPPPPGSGSGSGGSGSDGSGSGGGGGGGTTFVDCCAPAVPNTLYLTLGGAMASMGTIAIINQNGGNGWSAFFIGGAPCSDGTGANVATLICSAGKWTLNVQTINGNVSPSNVAGFGVGGLTASSCDPFLLSGSATATGAGDCIGNVTYTVTR